MTDQNSIARVLDNPYDNVYWLARLLISSDKYAGTDDQTFRRLWSKGQAGRSRSGLGSASVVAPACRLAPYPLR